MNTFDPRFPPSPQPERLNKQHPVIGEQLGKLTENISGLRSALSDLSGRLRPLVRECGREDGCCNPHPPRAAESPYYEELVAANEAICEVIAAVRNLTNDVQI